MSDTTLNAFVGEGDAAAMSGFTPSPPTPASGPDPLYIFRNTDDLLLYYWTGAAWAAFATTASAIPAIQQLRLTGTTGVPVTTGDVTAIATLYLTPYIGNRISLFTSSVWQNYETAEVSLALTGLIVGVCYDVFAYDSGGNVTLEVLAWKKVASSSSPTAGSNKTLLLADTATLVVGMDVTVKDGSASEIARITTVTASTSIVVDTLANSYTTPDVYGYRARATDLTTQDGVLVKTAATDRRYLGTICISATTGQTTDSAASRFIWNYYNRVDRQMSVIETTDSWNYSTATLRQTNGSKANQLAYVVGVLEDSVEARAHSLSATSGATARTRVGGIGQNRTATNDAQGMGYMAGTSAYILEGNAFYNGYPPIGRNYLAWLESGGGADTQTFYGDAGSPNVQNGIIGKWRG